MRRGELLKLRWSDVNFVQGTITVRAFNTKTLRAREIGMTTRLAACLIELERHRAPERVERDPLVFGLTDIKKSFAGACVEAKITGCRFHDLRHTAATRLVQGGLALEETGRILGHSQPSTTYRDTNLDTKTLDRAAEILNRLAERFTEPEAAVEERESVN